MEEAIATAFGVSLEAVRRANLLLGDIGETARLAQQRRLAEAGLIPFRPVKFMLASPEETATDIWERMTGKSGFASDDPAEKGRAGCPQPAASDGAMETSRTAGSAAVWVEDKYDGIRCQLHKVGERIALYSRDLKEITGAFLEIADAARDLPGNWILDGELLAMRGEQVLAARRAAAHSAANPRVPCAVAGRVWSGAHHAGALSRRDWKRVPRGPRPRQ